MNARWIVGLVCVAASSSGCATAHTRPRPTGWERPEVVVPAAPFHGVHGLAIDARGRLLAGTVVGNDMWEVDRNTGAARVFIPAPEGEADDIAIGPKGELAWTSYTQGIVRFRENDAAPIRELARGLAGINSLAFDRQTGTLYASQVFYGDALWEIDVAGRAAPRLIARDMGGFNGFEVGPDGMLYGPLWFKGQLVKIDPANGNLTVINSEYQTPAAANLDGHGSAWVVDTRTGELSKVALDTGKRTLFAKLKTSLDNLAIAPEGTIYVSNMADNSVQAVDPVSGEVKLLTRGRLATPGDIAIDGDSVFIADVFAVRAVDTARGEIRDVLRAHASHLEYPSGIGIGGDVIALTSWATGSLQLLDRKTQAEREVVHGFKAPMDALPLADGSILVAELGTGSILRMRGAHYGERSVVATGLAGPTQLALGNDGALYVVDAAGNLTRIDLESGAQRVVASRLALPDGIAVTPWGSLVIAESAARRVIELNPVDGTRRVVAEKLPIGFNPGRPGVPPPFLPTGIAVAQDGTLYVASDRDQSLLRIRPQR